MDWSPVPEAAGVPWRSCRVLPIPAGVQSCGRGQPGPGVTVHVLASGLQIFLMGLCSSALVWAARWDGRGSQEPVELRVPPCTGLWPPPDRAQRAEEGGWATVWRWLREAAPHLPAHRRFLRSVIQEARAEQEEPPAPGGRRGGRKPLLPFMLCWALPASRSLRSTGRAEPLPLGAAGGPGRCHPLLSLWGSGCRARGLPGNAPALPSSPHGCPRFPGMAGGRSHCLGSSFPQSLCPGVLGGSRGGG